MSDRNPGLAPDWMDASIRTFGERIEMLCCAYAAKHGEKPLLVYEDLRSSMLMVGRVCRWEAAPQFPIRQSVLHDLVGPGARAWEVWSAGLDPDQAAVVLRVTPHEAVVSVERWGAELRGRLTDYANSIRALFAPISEKLTGTRVSGGIVFRMSDSSDPPLIQRKPWDRCHFVGCTKRATGIAVGRTNYQLPAPYCDDHAELVAADESPEFQRRCPNCHCLQGYG